LTTEALKEEKRLRRRGGKARLRNLFLSDLAFLFKVLTRGLGFDNTSY
jgi:hypothetical protein